jgi:hypothetical protein
MGEAEKDTLKEPVIRVGVSTCLLGEPVRYDGGHKLDRYLTGTLGQFFEWVPVCPEVEMGLPTPRESMRLVGDADAPRLVAPKTRCRRGPAGACKSWRQLAYTGLYLKRTVLRRAYFV